MSIKTYIHTLLFIIAFLTLLACGGGGGGGGSNTSTVIQGQFIDSIVSGLRYETATTSGFTDSQGKFNYRNGETIRFFIGDVFIGEASGQAIITPVELVSTAIDEKNIQVQNIVMFLQSIDDDGDESNGINITTLARSAAQGQSVNFTLASGVFEADGSIQTLISNITSANGIARSMVSRTQASNTFRSNLTALFAGNYQGNFSGDDTGTWTATINNNGEISGLRKSTIFGDAGISGGVDSSGQSTIKGNIDTVVFSGIFTRNGNVSGSWLDDDGSSGTFSGQRISTPVIPGGTTPLPPTNNFGSITISGNDAAIIGTSYIPNVNPVVIKDTLFNTGTATVSWSQSLVSNTEFESRSMSFRFNEINGNLFSVFYTRLTANDPVSGPTSFYSYFVDCEDDPQACSGIILDAAQQQLTFSNTRLVVDTGNNNATGIIELNGFLKW